jgi:hypothetical protein
MNNNEEEVKDLVDQLQRLQIQQTTLLARLERATEGATNNERDENPPTRPTRADRTTRAPPRALAIGDWVIIQNPKPSQITRGQITKINLLTDRYTIRDSTGSRPTVRSRGKLIRDDR